MSVEFIKSCIPDEGASEEVLSYLRGAKRETNLALSGAYQKMKGELGRLEAWLGEVCSIELCHVALDGDVERGIREIIKSGRRRLVMLEIREGAENAADIPVPSLSLILTNGTDMHYILKGDRLQCDAVPIGYGIERRAEEGDGHETSECEVL